MKRYHSIDVVKFFMAMCVIAMHTTPLINCSSEVIQRVYTAIVSHAVPFFFVASGFFLGKKIDWAGKRENVILTIKEYILKIVKLYVVWNVVYLPMAIYDHIRAGRSVVKMFILYLRGFFFVGEHYNSWMLWYLLSMIYTLLMIIWLVKKGHSRKRMMYLGVILFIFIPKCIGYVDRLAQMNMAAALLDRAIEFVFGNGRLLQGAVYIPMGLYLADEKVSEKLSMIFLGIGFLGSCLFSETLFNVSIMISTFGLFCTVLQLEVKNSKISGYCRTMSTVMYFIHMYVWTIYYCLRFAEKTFGMESFLATTVVSAAIGILYHQYKSSDKKGGPCERNK